MTRSAAFALSDSLVESGFSHEVLVGVHDSMNPREQYTVHVRCNLKMAADEIDNLEDIARKHDLRLEFVQDNLEDIARKHGLRLAFVQPAFTFDER